MYRRKFRYGVFSQLTYLLLVCALCLTYVASSKNEAKAAEDAKGIYLLGFTTSMSGFVPPPGMYGSSIKYFYSGDATGAAADSIGLDRLGNITLEADLEADVDVFIDVLTGLVVTPHQILGGHLGFGILVPIGWQQADIDVDVRAALTLPDGRTFTAGRSFNVDDDTFAIGDPLLTAFLGWHRGNWHWKLAGLLNIPVGSYDEDGIVNMGFNRWAFDTTASVTWLDQATGREASVAAGFTFNGENDDTNYDTGTEFHVEWALVQNFSKAFGIGVVGYHYQQVSGDSGAGATLGSFKGRVTAIGPNINLNFQLGQLPVSTSVRWLHEFNVKNRLEGNTVLGTVTIPLGAPRGGQQK